MVTRLKLWVHLLIPILRNKHHGFSQSRFRLPVFSLWRIKPKFDLFFVFDNLKRAGLHSRISRRSATPLRCVPRAAVRITCRQAYLITISFLTRPSISIIYIHSNLVTVYS